MNDKHPSPNATAAMIEPGQRLYRNGQWHTVKRIQPDPLGRVYVCCDDATYLIPMGDEVPISKLLVGR